MSVAELAHIKERARDALVQALGYRRECVRVDQPYTHWGSMPRESSIGVAAYKDYPLDYTTACIGVAVAESPSGGSSVTKHKDLGAPLIFEAARDTTACWALRRGQPPEWLDSFPTNQLFQRLARRRSEWGPQRIYDAKFEPEAQLDFVDIGLMPAIGSQARRKLDSLLKDLNETISEAWRSAGGEPSRHSVLLLMFGMLAAKALRDRGEPGAWESDDAHSVWAAVIDRYQLRGVASAAVDAGFPRQAVTQAWSKARASFLMHNLCMEDLRHVYEETFVDRETRRRMGTHATPTAVADFVVERLHLEREPLDEVRVFEPFAGAGPFLVAAFRHLAKRMPADWDRARRHGFLVERLVGMERDPFARLLCWLNLLFADDLDSDGWQVLGGDVYTDPALPLQLARCSVLLCNPPFEHHRLEQGAPREHQALTALRMVLEQPPKYLGFVLPLVFAQGPAMAAARAQVARCYSEIELIALPDRLFAKGDAETVLLLATDRQRRQKVHSRSLDLRHEPDRDFGRLLAKASVTGRWAEGTAAGSEIWTPKHHLLWAALKDRPSVSSVAEPRKGLQIAERRLGAALAAGGEGGGVPWAWRATGLRQYSPVETELAPADPAWLRRGDLDLDWSAPKVIANAHMTRRDGWPLSAWTDYDGLYARDLFWVLRPYDQRHVELLTAVLNGPVAAAWVTDHAGKRDILGDTIRTCPMPDMERLNVELLRDKVGNVEAYIADLQGPGDSSGYLANCVAEIDLLVLDAYGIPAQLSDALREELSGHDRPGLGPIDLSAHWAAARAAIDAERQWERLRHRYHELVRLDMLHRATPPQLDELLELRRRLEERLAPDDEARLAALLRKLEGGAG